ncbi:MAG: iron-sulfur cluster assembly protein [Candidatus Bathyarchaeia archaeon]
MTDLEDKVLNEIGKIIDLETGLALNEMKMIQLVKEIEHGVVKIDFTPTSPVCPMAIKIAVEIRNKAENVEGVKKALVYVRGHIMENEINERINK